MSLPITKKQFNDSIIPFIEKYKRLPFLPEDDVEIKVKNEKDQMEIRPYRAGRYISSFYKTQENMIEKILEDKVITYELVEEVTGVKKNTLKDIISGKDMKKDNVARICVENFFDKDFFKKENKFADKCITCKSKCKQKYNVILVKCKNFEKK